MRTELGFSDRGEIVYFSPLDIDDKFVILEADGYGGATTKVIEGNYPLDFFISHEKSFPLEATALEVAEAVTEGTRDATEILAFRDSWFWLCLKSQKYHQRKLVDASDRFLPDNTGKELMKSHRRKLVDSSDCF